MFKRYLQLTGKSLKGMGMILLFMMFGSLISIFVGVMIFGQLNIELENFFKGVGLLVGGLLIIFYLRRKQKKIYNSFIKAVKFDSKELKLFLVITNFTLLFLYLTFAIAGIFDFYTFVHFGTNVFEINQIVKHTMFFGMATFVLGPIGEEILFRGYLLNYLNIFVNKRFNAILISSALFAIGHLHYQDYLNFVIAFSSGIVMGYGYLKFNSILIPIAVHSSYNIFNFTIASDPGRGPQVPYLVKFDYVRIADKIGAWVDLFIIVGFIFTFIYLFKKNNGHVNNTINKQVGIGINKNILNLY